MFIGSKAIGFDPEHPRIFQDPDDGLPRLELDDSDARFLLPMPRDGRWTFQTHKLSQVLDHPSLYRAYPSLERVVVILSNNPNPTSIYGSTKFIDNEPVIKTRIGAELTVDYIQAHLLHETQHIIQETEGFGSGASLAREHTSEKQRIRHQLQEQSRQMNPLAPRQEEEGVFRFVKRMIGHKVKNALSIEESLDRIIVSEAFNNRVYLNYYRASGEIEARTVEARASMPDQARQLIHPLGTRHLISLCAWRYAQNRLPDGYTIDFGYVQQLHLSALERPFIPFVPRRNAPPVAFNRLSLPPRKWRHLAAPVLKPE